LGACTAQERFAAVRFFFFLLLAITDFIYNDHSYGGLYVDSWLLFPCLKRSERMANLPPENAFRQKAFSLTNNLQPNVLAGRYQKRQSCANRIYKFVKHFSFREAKNDI